MDERGRLAERFEQHRDQLRAAAYRMLGSLDEADDAVQETWLRLDRADVSEVANLAAWLRTVVSRICLDMLRSRAARREEPAGPPVPDHLWDGPEAGNDPEQEALLLDSVGRALLVVLDRLAPEERVALVLHDSFAVPFDQIGPIVARSPATAKKLASRARQKVRGRPAGDAGGAGDPATGRRPADPREAVQRQAAQREVVEAFLAAARAGDIAALLAVLAPNVVRRADPVALPPGVPRTAAGARTVAEQTAAFGPRARFAETALVDGAVGAVVAPRGRLLLALTFSFGDGLITGYEVIADPARLRRLDLALPPRAGGDPHPA